MLTYSRPRIPHQRLPSLIHHRHHASLTNTDYDMIIYVGNEPSIRTFHAHSEILRNQSSYFLAALSSRWIQRENGMIIFRKPNISPEVFEVILSFCYTGQAKLQDKDGAFVIELLVSADEMILTSLTSYIQKNFTTAQLSWLQDNCLEITQFAFQYPSFQALQNRVQRLIPRGNGAQSRLINWDHLKYICGWIDQSTIVIMKVSGTDELLGGYNPLTWNINTDGSTMNSFIFSFKNGQSNNPCVSYIQRKFFKNAIYKLNSDIEVINFGNGDLRLDCNFNESFSCSARKNSYEFNIRDDSSSFCVESFEVFKIINRNE
ncbi:unnamed protein product [Rhizophagus irregularis]|uniref:BTB domain-containing protein n=1 Tax=Rhizophagus irregularis TaxID=588596 RepID=A0A915ZW52_9GLOM|nr:unnamed protein product [Rhizophagus irregularis]